MDAGRGRGLLRRVYLCGAFLLLRIGLLRRRVETDDVLQLDRLESVEEAGVVLLADGDGVAEELGGVVDGASFLEHDGAGLLAEVVICDGPVFRLEVPQPGIVRSLDEFFSLVMILGGNDVVLGIEEIFQEVGGNGNLASGRFS